MCHLMSYDRIAMIQHYEYALERFANAQNNQNILTDTVVSHSLIVTSYYIRDVSRCFLVVCT